MKAVSLLKYLLAILIVAAASYTEATPATQAAITSNAQGEVHPFMPFRSEFSATVLNNDNILIVGGSQSNGQATTSVEIFDVNTRRFFSVPSTTFAHQRHFALHLKDDRVVIESGVVADPANNTQFMAYTPEVYNPVAATWTPLREIQFAAGEEVEAAELDDGNVLFVASNEAFMRQSTQANARQFHAWLWDTKRNTVSKKNINVTARAAAGFEVLHDGRVLFTGGHTLAYEAEERCEEIPAKQARAQGVVDGDWCASHGVWRDGAIADTEIWDSRNETVTVMPASPLKTWGELYLQALRNGDVLVVNYRQSRFEADNDKLQAAIWSAENGNWRKISDAPAAVRMNLRQHLLELKDGTLLGNAVRYSVADDVWTATPSVAMNTALLQLNNNKILALSLSEPYLKIFEFAKQQWQASSSNAYLRTHENATLALRDGRLLVAGILSDSWSRQTVVQLWDPRTDHWSLQTPTEDAMHNIQLVQLVSGEILRVGLGVGGMLACYRWSLSENINDSQWLDCGHLQLTAGPPDLSLQYENEDDRPAIYNYALGSLEDGRALLVESTEQAKIYNEQNNSWSAVALVAHEQALVQGAPIRFPEPLYQFHDVATNKLIDVSHMVMRFKLSEVNTVYPDMLWDARNNQWAYIFTQMRMGRNAVMLPDGCAIALAGGSFRLFDAATGNVRQLTQPTIRMNQPALAVLPDGTVTVAGNAYDINDRGPGFFAEHASCQGFESAAGDTVNAAEKNKLTPTKTVAAQSTQSSRSWLSDYWQWLLRYRWTVLIIIGSVLTYLVLKKIIRRAAKYDQPVNAPNTGFVVRLVIYGGLGIVFGPMLWSLVFNHSANTDDESDAGKQPWYQTVSQRDALPKNLSIPCRFVGFWDARNTNPESTLEFRYSMFDDGHVEIYPVQNGMAGDAIFKGNWAFHGKDIIWLKEGSSTTPQIDHIVNAEQSRFTVQQADGQYREFYLKAGVGRTNCVADGLRQNEY